MLGTGHVISVGRVGGLAIALGIGGLGIGVLSIGSLLAAAPAWADDSQPAVSRHQAGTPRRAANPAAGPAANLAGTRPRRPNRRPSRPGSTTAASPGPATTWPGPSPRRAPTTPGSAHFADGVSTLRTGLPNPRTISNLVVAGNAETPERRGAVRDDVRLGSVHRPRHQPDQLR